MSQDIVGDETHPAVYMAFTEEEIAIRVRVSNIDGTNPYAFKNFVFIGVDADLNGSIDFFLGLYNPTGNNGRLGIYGTNSGYTNMSPSTTGITKPLMGIKPEADVNYEITPADSTLNGTTNYFISFKFKVADITQALSSTAYSNFDKSKAFRFICGTAAQENSFNQDINGMDRGGWSSGGTWSSLDIFSDIVSADGTAQSRFCTVTFDKNTGDTEANYSVKAVEIDTALGGLPGTIPTKRGMYFQEWNTKPDGSGVKVSSETVITGNTTFYAIWSDKAVYTVTFDPVGDYLGGNFSGSTASITVPTINGVIGDNMPVDPTTTNTNYPNFIGWKDNQGNIYNSSTPITGDIVVHAMWTKGTLLATFYDNIGDNGGSVAAKLYANGSFGNTPLPTITRPGYTFNGWIFNGSAVTGGKVTGAGDYYAQWIPANYAVTFDGNGGGDTVNNVPGQKAITDGTFGTMPPEPTRDGYRFIEWNRTTDGTGEAMYPSTIISGATTVYAIWEKVTTVTFDANGGVDDDQQINATSGELDYFPQPTSRDGFTFLGWSESNDNDSSKLVDLAGQNFSADKTLYAVWAPIYDITFDGNNGDWGGSPAVITQIPDVPTAYGSVLYIPTAPTRDGFDFIGWKDSSDASGNTFTISSEVTASMTVYAQWQTAGGAPQSVSVMHIVTNLTYSGGATATTGVPYNDTLTPATGYDRPAAITITVNGSTLNAGTDYTYNSGNGSITIPGDKITGNIVITAAAQIKTFSVTDQVDHGSIPGNRATYGTDYDTTITAETGYTLPPSVSVTVGGTPLAAGDYTYNSTTGAVHINGNKVTGDIIIIASNSTLKTYAVDHSGVTNISYTGGATATHGVAYNDTLTASTGYNLPDSITITVGGNTLTADSDYTYTKSTGAVTINAGKITGDVVISATGVIKTFTVTDDVDNCTFPDATATYGTDYITMISAEPGYSLPSSVTITVGGSPLEDGYTYDSTTGDVSIAGAKITGNIIISDTPSTTYGVTHAINYMSHTGGSSAVSSADYEDVLTAAAGYDLPGYITITVGGVTLTDGYTYDVDTGEIVINKDRITGEIVISADGIPKTFSVTDQVEHGTFTGDTATYGSDYDTTIIADTGFSLPPSVSITVGGTLLDEGDYTYDSTTGAVHIDGSKVTGNIAIIATDSALITYSVNHNVTNISYIGGTTAAYGVNYSDTLTAVTGYNLPDTITITVGGSELNAGTDFTYDNITGAIWINGGMVTGNIEITAAGVLKTFAVTDQVDTGTFADIAATYGADYDTVIIPDTGRQLPKNIIVTVGGTMLTEGFTYDPVTGAIHIDGAKITGPVVIIAGVIPQPQPQAYADPAPIYAGNNTDEPEADPARTGNYPVAYSGTNFRYSGAGAVHPGTDYKTTIIVAAGYQLPSAITVTAGGILLKPGVDYTYNSETGEVYIKGAKVTGAIEIKALPLVLKEVPAANVRVKDKVPKTGDRK